MTRISEDLTTRITSGSGCMAARIEDMNPRGFRVAQYPDGSKRVQGAYQWSEGNSWGVDWRDLPLVYVDESGKERVNG